MRHKDPVEIRQATQGLVGLFIGNLSANSLGKELCHVGNQWLRETKRIPSRPRTGTLRTLVNTTRHKPTQERNSKRPVLLT